MMIVIFVMMVVLMMMYCTIMRFDCTFCDDSNIIRMIIVNVLLSRVIILSLSSSSPLSSPLSSSSSSSCITTIGQELLSSLQPGDVILGTTVEPGLWRLVQPTINDINDYDTIDLM